MKMFTQLIKTIIVFTFFSIVCVNVYAANTIDGIRVWPAPENTRVVFDLSAKPEYKYFTLNNPERLVIDFKHSKNATALKNVLKKDKRITKIRTSTPKNKTTTRLVLELKESYKTAIFPLAPAGSYGNRLVVDLFDKNRTVKTVEKNSGNGKRAVSYTHLTLPTIYSV